MCAKTLLAGSLLWLFLFFPCFAQEEPIENIGFHQLSFDTTDVLKRFSSVGMLTFNYVPPDQMMFLNMLAYSPFNNEPYWIVQNELLVNKANNPRDYDSRAVRFRMDSAGYPIALPGLQIFYNYMVTPEPLTQPYDFTILPVLNAPVRTYTVNTGWGNFGANSWQDQVFPKIIWLPGGLVIGNFFYYGCSVPNYDLEGNSGKEGCGPAAAANSMCWMEGKYGFNIPGGLGSAYNDFNNLMRRMEGNGVSFTDFIRAKLNFIEMYDLPIIVEYQIEGGKNGDQIGSSTGNSHATCKNTGQYPDRNWLIGQGQAGADIEAWVVIDKSQGSFGLHIVTITGSWSLNGVLIVNFKHDNDQQQSDSTRAAGGEGAGTTSEGTPVVTGNKGEMIMEGFTFNGVSQSAAVSRLVTERYDSTHKPRKKKLDFKSYCDYQSVMVPPGATVTFTYPNDSTRGFNNTVYTEDFRADQSASASPRTKVTDWNSNSGKERSYVNNDSCPQMVTIHNDDQSKSYADPQKPYSVGFSVTVNESGRHCVPEEAPTETTPGNPEDYAGFSLGWGDNSSDEFGTAQGQDIVYSAAAGCRLNDFPAVIGGTVHSVRLKYPIAKRNVFWDNLELRITADSLIKPGKLRFTLTPGSFTDTVEIAGTEGIVKKIDCRFAGSDTFDITLEPIGNTEFAVDYLAVSPVVAQITTGAVADGEYCAGDSLVAEFELFYDLPEPGNFRVELSDSAGSFNFPVTIGTALTAKALSINCRIEDETAEGNGYRIRVTSGGDSTYCTDNGSDITIHAKPEKPVIAMSNDTLTSSSVTGCRWFYEDEAIEGEDGKVLIADKNGKYRVIAVSDHGCLSDTSAACVYSGENEVQSFESSEPELYWNRATNTMIIRNAGSNGGKLQIAVYDIVGQQVLEEYTDCGQECEVFFRAIAVPGVYFVRIVAGGSAWANKLLIY